MALVSIAIVEAVGFPPSLWGHSSGALFRCVPATRPTSVRRVAEDTNLLKIFMLKALINLRLER